MTVKCANGDTVLYPLAWVTITIMDGVTVKTKAAVAGLPVSVLLSTDIRELGQLLQANRTTMYTQGMEQALVTTMAQARLQNHGERL